MSETLATFEAVQKAYRELADEGLPVSADRIRKRTGGSKQTVLNHLQAIRRDIVVDGKVADSMDGVLHAAANPFLKKIWAVARQQSDAAFAPRIRDLEAVQAGLLDDVRDLIETNAALERRAEEAEALASGRNSQDEQLTRLIELVEGFGAAGVERRTPSLVQKTVPPDRLPLMWQLLRLLQLNETLQGRELREMLEASGYTEVSIRRARSDALEEELLGLKVTKKGRDVLKAIEGLSSNITPNKRNSA